MSDVRKTCQCMSPSKDTCGKPAVDFVEYVLPDKTVKCWMCIYHYDGWMVAAKNQRVWKV